MTDFDRFADQYQAVLDDKVKFSGDTSAYFTDYKARHLARYLGQAWPGRLLDFGCGVGNLSDALRRYLGNAHIDGYDISAQSILRVPAALRQQGTFTSSLTELSCRYDAIVLSNVLHHVPPERRRPLVADLAGRLEPSGILAVFEHNPLNPATRWVVATCPFDEEARLLWPREARALFDSVRLAVRRRDYIVFFPSILSRLRPLEPYLRWLPAGAQYCIIGAR